jgi:sigma-B regulation protein RsbU (phosphoserine phosphatase)
MDIQLVGVSIVAQAAAAVLALRLNYLYGRRLAWTLIATALVVMTVPRVATFLDLVSGGSSPSLLRDGWRRVPDPSTGMSCLASILLLAGVILIHPLFQTINEAEQRLREENVRLGDTVRQSEAELRVARRIQRHLLPRSAPKIDGYQCSGTFVPAFFVGGDYFDYLPLPSGEMAFVVADVCGHGVGAAIQMAQVRTILNTVAQTASEPSQMLEITHDQFSKTARDGQFVSVFLACLEPETGRLRYCGAGHDAWIVRKDGKHRRLRSTGMVLGVLPDTQVRTESVTLLPGELLLIHTDGVVEAHAPGKVLFGRDRVLAYVGEHRSESAQEIAEGVCNEARRFAGGSSPHDDMTVVVLKANQRPQGP